MQDALSQSLWKGGSTPSKNVTHRLKMTDLEDLIPLTSVGTSNTFPMLIKHPRYIPTQIHNLKIKKTLHCYFRNVRSYILLRVMIRRSFKICQCMLCIWSKHRQRVWVLNLSSYSPPVAKIWLLNPCAILDGRYTISPLANLIHW